jgi:hypothetical protein
MTPEENSASIWLRGKLPQNSESPALGSSRNRNIASQQKLQQPNEERKEN